MAEIAPLKFMAIVLPLTAGLSSCLIVARNYSSYQFATEQMAQSEAYIKKLEGKPTLPQDQQAREEMIKGWMSCRDYWAARLKTYDLTGASKIYNFVDKMKKK